MGSPRSRQGIACCRDSTKARYIVKSRNRGRCSLAVVGCPLTADLAARLEHGLLARHSELRFGHRRPRLLTQTRKGLDEAMDGEYLRLMIDKSETLHEEHGIVLEPLPSLVFLDSIFIRFEASCQFNASIENWKSRSRIFVCPSHDLRPFPATLNRSLALCRAELEET